MIRRSRHNSYPPIDHYTTLNASTVNRVIGHDIDLKYFFKNLNKKLEGVLKVINSRLHYREDYVKYVLKRIPQEKITLRIEFTIEKS